MEQPPAAPRPVSRRMVLAIVLALIFITVPATLAGIPMSKLKVTVVNMSQTISLEVTVRVYSISGPYESFAMSPGTSHTVEFTLTPGTYQIEVNYNWYESSYGYHWGNTFSSESVAYLSTAEVSIPVYPS